MNWRHSRVFIWKRCFDWNRWIDLCTWIFGQLENAISFQVWWIGIYIKSHKYSSLHVLYHHSNCIIYFFINFECFLNTVLFCIWLTRAWCDLNLCSEIFGYIGFFLTFCFSWQCNMHPHNDWWIIYNIVHDWYGIFTENILS